jgi:hypothetical protein
MKSLILVTALALSFSAMADTLTCKVNTYAFGWDETVKSISVENKELDLGLSAYGFKITAYVDELSAGGYSVAIGAVKDDMLISNIGNNSAFLKIANNAKDKNVVEEITCRVSKK